MKVGADMKKTSRSRNSPKVSKKGRVHLLGMLRGCLPYSLVLSPPLLIHYRISLMDMVPVYRFFNTLYYLFMETQNEMIFLAAFL